MRYAVLCRFASAVIAVLLAGVLVTGFAEDVPTMRAWVYHEYGGPEVLQWQSLPRPVPASGRILVRVHAAAVDPYDWHLLRAEPWLIRLSTGLRKPSDPRVGVDFAGTVEAVGDSVTRFHVGDDVYGGADGSFGQYVTAREVGSVALKPTNLSFEQAAAVPMAAQTALQALRDKAQVHSGQRVLINGASGGVGTFAVQIARSMGADVTGVCGTSTQSMVRSLGADHVIDYSSSDFTRGPQRYDVIIDTVGSHSILEYRRAMTPNGILVIVGERTSHTMWGAVWPTVQATVVSWFVSQKFKTLIAGMTQSDLTALKDLIEAGKLKPVIDRTYPVQQVAAALTYVEAGHSHGKVVLSVP